MSIIFYNFFFKCTALFSMAPSTLALQLRHFIIYMATASRLVGSSVNTTEGISVGHRYSVAVHVSWNAEISNLVDPS